MGLTRTISVAIDTLVFVLLHRTLLNVAIVASYMHSLINYSYIANYELLLIYLASYILGYIYMHV